MIPAILTPTAAGTLDINVLTFTTLYPNAEQPGHGLFVERRLLETLKQGGLRASVVAPVPWFPFRSERFGGYGRFARIPRSERRHGLDIFHPRYPVIPKIGMTWTPRLMTRALKPAVAARLADGAGFDLIDAHYFYPDGVAAAALGRAFGKPVVITARGTDINLIADYAAPRRMMLEAAEQAHALVAVCQALKDRMVELGMAADKITVLRNGVDLEQFRPPMDRTALRRRLGLSGPTLISVGQLIPRKGHDLVIRALPALPDADLLIAGDGPERTGLARLAADLGVANRVRFLGYVPAAELPGYFGAADVSVLASSREGWANVLLEAMACGTPVAASNVWGTPEVVAGPAAGRLFDRDDPRAVTATIAQLLNHAPGRDAVRAYAERFSWEETARGQKALFRAALAPSQ